VDAFSDQPRRVLMSVLLAELRTIYAKIGCGAACVAELNAVFQTRYPELYEEVVGLHGAMRKYFVKIELADLVAMQYMSEIMHLAPQGERIELGCTGAVVCSPDGSHVVHGRNLDWGMLTLVKLLWS
jgi:hypothetical protein